VILTGTGSVEHLTQNVDAILAPPLPDDVSARLGEIFGRRLRIRRLKKVPVTVDLFC
jgi:hypothetical protein